jgi:putative membrane protein
MELIERIANKQHKAKYQKGVSIMMGFDLILITAVIAYVLGWRPQFNQSRPAQTNQTPLGLLKERYARGEISREEFEQMRSDLGD